MRALDASTAESLKSPCIEICALDARAGHCTGCGRSLAEIAEWGSASADRKRDFLVSLPKRMARLAAGLLVIL